VVLPKSMPIDLICMTMILRLGQPNHYSAWLLGGGPSHYRDYTHNRGMF